ncbi:MAG: hypothetical protein PF480_08980 [Roseovarius sp.]|jgi:hypothetical protein|nr:hypothetical protein [Roseovarius sp.]
MSDPVTNVEIEDVLSSIRRLVSNGQDGVSVQSEPMDMPKAETANRLVLTPSLRVDDRDGVDQSGIAPPENEPENHRPDPQGVAALDREARDDAAEDAAQEEASTAAAADEDHDEALKSDALRRGDEDCSAQDNRTQDDQIEGPAEPHHGATASEGDIWLDAVDPASEADEPMQEDDDATVSADQDQADADAGTADESEPQDDTALLSDLEAQAAEFEAAVANRDDQWEPDGESGDDYAGGRVTSLSWSDAEDGADDPDEEELSADPDWAEADDVASARHAQTWEREAMPVPPVEDWGEDSGMMLDDAVLDEEALRDMVSEIVRQELQGALGERITRNVRKLVRREIHRALASQDMD